MRQELRADDTGRYVQLRILRDTWQRLTELANQDRRSLVAELDVLLEEELKRREAQK